MPGKFTYRGRFIEDLSREELISALEAAYSAIAQERKMSQCDLDMERAFAEAKERCQPSRNRQS